MDHRTFVIVGAGLAGATGARALREEGFDGRIVLVGAEPHAPYERPPLSKGYLLGTAPRESAFVHDDAWYAGHGVELVPATRATGLDTAARTLTLDGSDRLGYDALLLTTGASPRRLDVPGAESVDVAYLRTLDDSERLRAAFRPGARVVVVGGGWIGLEAAAAARSAGSEVTVLEQADLPLVRVLGPEVAPLFAALHRSHGVDLRCGVRLARLRPAAGERSAAVVLEDGDDLAADVVLAGVGVVPDVELARSGGLAVEDGIVVDAALRTSDPHVFAAGDVARAAHPLLGGTVRVEHWANALNQPATAARSMLGLPASYDRLPYFFTDQYDLGMEYTGYVGPGGYEQVVFRGDPASGAYLAFWLAEGRVLAGMNVNTWDVADAIGDLVRSRRRVDAGRLADPSVDLADVLRSAA